MALMERLIRNNNTLSTINSKTHNLISDELKDIKADIHQEVIETINRKQKETGKELLEDKNQIINTIQNVVDKREIKLSLLEKQRLCKEIFNDVAGLGPIEPLLSDNEITEIMVNGPNNVYIEKHGKIEETDIKFRDDAHVLQVIDRIVSSVGRHIDESSPMVDARLSDGSRVNAIIFPLSIVGPVLTIRKFSKQPITIQDLIEYSSISPDMLSFLNACVKGRLNIIISGGTSSGKTTLLNILSGFISDSERIITIEDSAELQLRQRHVVTLESRPPNTEGCGEVTIRALVRNALRMRPDRLVVGEVRSGETLDMLQAMNTGHEGSMATAHANSARDLISRLETMVLMAGIDIPVKAIREQIASSINLIVHHARLHDGTRKIVKITEVDGMEGEVITLQDVFVYKAEGLNRDGTLKGSFVPTGAYPKFIDKLRLSGIAVNDEWFS